MDNKTIQLIKAAQGLDGKAALELSRRYQNLIRNVVCSMTASPTDEHISAANTGFLEAVMNMDTENEASLISYATGYIKKEVSSICHEQEELSSEEYLDIKSAALKYIASIESDEDHFILLASTCGFPLLGNLTVPEISERLNISEKTVRKHKSKLLQCLSEYLDGYAS